MSASSSAAGCCPPGSEGPLSDQGSGNAVTSVVSDGSEYFVAGSGKLGLLVIPDIWGPSSGRLKQIVEFFANEGFNVLMPTLFNAWVPDPPQGQDAIMAWIKSHPFDSFKQRLEDARQYLIQERGAEVIGAIGFCWGCWAIFNLSKKDGALACGVHAHPSLRIEHMFNGEGSADDLARKTRCPHLLMPAGNDPDHVQKDGSVIKVLKELPHGSTSRVEPFPEMIHGWVNRGDLSFVKVKRDVDRALLEIALPFLRQHLVL